MLSTRLIIYLDGRLVDTDVLGGDDVPDLSTSFVNCGLQREKKVTNALLEGDQVALREGIRLGNDRDQVNAGTKSFHNFDVKWLETGEKITRRPRI